jgi:Polyketide cyclase / dehydrase and lipid transport
VSDYEFKTVWRYNAPIEAVWDEIKAIENWSEWWKGVLNVQELKSGDNDGVGAIYRTTWKSALPYKLKFDSEVVKVDHLKTIEARAFGELEGFGIWTFIAEDENVTRLQYDWRVIATKRWMKLLSPVAKPFFRWNHDVIMNWGGKGLAKKLNCKIL